MERLERVRLRRLLRGLDRAELAAPRARVPQQHDGARAPVPTLPDVGALGFLAHRVQVQLFQRGFQFLVLARGLRATTMPTITLERRGGRGELSSGKEKRLETKCHATPVPTYTQNLVVLIAFLWIFGVHRPFFAGTILILDRGAMVA